MIIVLTNDDGIQSEGLHVIARSLSAFADVYVFAPLCEKSGVGHGFTFRTPLAVQKFEEYDYPAYGVDGTPSDCIKIAECKFLEGQNIDLVISGLNNVENAGMAISYSGTVAGAREGAMWGIPSIAVSAASHSSETLEGATRWIEKFVKNSCHQEISENSFWNINFPEYKNHPTPKTSFCELSMVMYEDEYSVEGSLNKYSLSGYKPKEKFKENTDDFLFDQGFITITPLSIDQTSRSELQRLNQIEFNFLNA